MVSVWSAWELMLLPDFLMGVRKRPVLSTPHFVVLCDMVRTGGTKGVKERLQRWRGDNTHSMSRATWHQGMNASLKCSCSVP